jgi:signal transduction histidine kinase
MAEMRSLAPLLVYVVDEALELVGAERGYVVLSRSDGSLDFRVTRDRNGREVPHAEDQVSRSILRQVIQSGEPLILRDATLDPPFNRASSVVALQLRSIMCVPLMSRGETVGAIYVENRAVRGRFHENDLPPLTLFANQAAVAIENAALNDELETRVALRTRELERAMAQLEDSRLEATEANRLRTVLLGYVTHDMRSPLNVVVTSMELLQSGALGPLTHDQLEWVTKSLDAVGHVTSLTNDLLDLAKIEAGGLTLYTETIALSEFLRHIYGVGLGLGWPKAVAFRLDVPPDLPAASIDPVRIQQVLMNLLTNALKYTEHGSVTLYARLLADPAEVLIGVSDTGEGIAPEDADRLFQRFAQIDGDVRRRRLSTGLGLAICRELVEMHGGHIWMESAVGSGSNFMFTLPLNDVPASSTAQPVVASI